MTTAPNRRAGPDRRAVLAGLAGGIALAWAGPPGRGRAEAPAPLTKPIPATGEAVPVVGMGTWITFNVGQNERLRAHRTEILKAFFQAGGRMIDSSPMYGSAADVVGDGLARLGDPPALFSASKVWTSSVADGPEQMEAQRRRWGVPTFDLMQVHNLRAWNGHLKTLRAWKAEGRIRYLGITTSHGRRHDELVRILEREPLDFVQVTYNVLDRAVEDRILPLARDRGVAVIANRPYRQKDLFHRFQDKPLPPWAAQEADVHTWADFFIKFIVSHPAVTCAIPATSQRAHMAENMAAGTGRLPDAATRRRMIRYLEAL